jgi:hypothetical protein
MMVRMLLADRSRLLRTGFLTMSTRSPEPPGAWVTREGSQSVRMKRALWAIPFLLLLTACGNLVARTATVTATGPVVPAITRPVQFTGAQLAAALVPVSAFPRADRHITNTPFNSGNHLETGPATYKLSSISCADFAINFDGTGFGETALATSSYGTDPDAKSSGGFDQAVYQFASTGVARSFWRGLRSVVVRCPGLGAGHPPARSGASVTQRLSAGQMPGAQAFRLDTTIVFKLAGQTLVARATVWMAVAGQYVFDVDASGFNRPVPANPAAETVLHAVIARVLARARGHGGLPTVCIRRDSSCRYRVRVGQDLA